MELLCVVFFAYYIVLIARILLSWATMAWSPPPALAPAVRVIYDLTEPVLGMIRRYVPPLGGFDFSPLIVIFALRFLQAGIGC